MKRNNNVIALPLHLARQFDNPLKVLSACTVIKRKLKLLNKLKRSILTDPSMQTYEEQKQLAASATVVNDAMNRLLKVLQ